MMLRRRMRAALAIMALPLPPMDNWPLPQCRRHVSTRPPQPAGPHHWHWSQGRCARMAVIGPGFRVNGGGGRAQLPACSENQYWYATQKSR
jgi:hypothetical protein